MVKITTRSHLLYVAIAGAIIATLVILFLNPSNNINNSLLFLLGENNNKNQQPNEQGGGEEDNHHYYLRGAVNSTSGEGKQVLEKYEKHLCGESSEKK